MFLNRARFSKRVFVYQESTIGAAGAGAPLGVLALGDAAPGAASAEPPQDAPQQLEAAGLMPDAFRQTEAAAKAAAATATSAKQQGKKRPAMPKSTQSVEHLGAVIEERNNKWRITKKQKTGPQKEAFRQFGPKASRKDCGSMYMYIYKWMRLRAFIIYVHNVCV